jgi:hypothetical protein
MHLSPLVDEKQSTHPHSAPQRGGIDFFSVVKAPFFSFKKKDKEHVSKPC